MHSLLPFQLMRGYSKVRQDALDELELENDNIVEIIKNMNEDNKKENEEQIKSMIMDKLKIAYERNGCREITENESNNYSNHIDFIIEYACKNCVFEVFKLYYHGYRIPYWLDDNEPRPHYALYGSDYIRSAIRNKNAQALEKFILFDRQSFINECTSCYTRLDFDIKMFLRNRNSDPEVFGFFVNNVPLEIFGLKMG